MSTRVACPRCVYGEGRRLTSARLYPTVGKASQELTQQTDLSRQDLN